MTTRPQHRASLAARLRYRFDNALSRGPFIVIAYLALLTVLVILVTSIAVTVGGITFGGGVDDSFPEAVWQSMLRMVDAGTFAGDTAWPARAVAIVVTLVGIFLAGSLIGLIANAVDQQVEQLRRGRGAVLESGHSLILGWSPAVPRIIAELVIANESERSASIVVLAGGEKTEMEETIREVVPDLKTTTVVVRSGDPSNPADLDRVCVNDARSIVIVRDVDGDAGVVKAILALRSIDADFGGRHVVAEINADDNARTLRAVSNGRILTVSSDRVVAEVTAQACLRTGIAAVFADLLDFDGDEMYFACVPELAGRTYRESQLSFESSSVIGRITAAGTVELNPAHDTVLDADDRLIIVTSDDSAIAYAGTLVNVTAQSAPVQDTGRPPLRALVVGWSAFGRLVLEQLDEFLSPGSTVLVQIDADLVDPSSVQGVQLVNASLTVRAGHGGPEDLLSLREAGPFDQVILLAYRDSLDGPEADARTLLSLLALRMVWPKGNAEGVRIVAELIDQRNVQIAAPVGIDDLIVSDALTSMLMAQLSERGELLAVFEDLFEPTGAVLSLRPADTIVPAVPMTFGSIVSSASDLNASAFGYRLASTNTVVMNPSKSTVITLQACDEVLVIETRAASEATATR